MIYKEIEGVLVTFTLTTGVMGLGELQSETSDRDPRSSFMTELAWLTWGVPSLPTCVSFVYPERFDRLGGSVGLPAEISFFVSPTLAWGDLKRNLHRETNRSPEPIELLRINTET